MLVEKSRLPPAASARHARLREYFCDIDATAEDAGANWQLTLTWPDDAERHVDNTLDEGLAWWQPTLRRREMFDSRKRDGRVLRCLYDSWTLWSWSDWIARTPDASSRRIIVLHVDDHRDLGSPRLTSTSNGLLDMISGAEFDLAYPSSVEASIRSGALGMGSFMTPFLHRFPHVEVRHLCQPPKAMSTTAFKISRGMLPDDLLQPGASRPAVDLEPSASGGAGTYLLTPDLDAWLEGLEGATLLLHVDMDYFNNRYDGDSDWMFNGRRHDPDRAEVLAEIDRVADALRRNGVTERLEDIVVANSPGFFPGEFWREADARLSSGLGI